MKYKNRKKIVMIKKVGGYFTTIVAALGSVYFLTCGEFVLSLIAAAFSFGANYYTEFVVAR
jgi:hypothetical protein